MTAIRTLTRDDGKQIRLQFNGKDGNGNQQIDRLNQNGDVVNVFTEQGTSNSYVGQHGKAGFTIPTFAQDRPGGYLSSGVIGLNGHSWVM